MNSKEAFRIETQTFKVQMGRWELVEYPGLIQSGGLGPCIAIGVYDPTSRRGYMSHDACALNTEMLPEFLKKLTSNCSNLSKLRFYVTGAAHETEEPEANPGLDRNREFVRKGLLEMFAEKQVIFDWTLDDYTNELFLDTKTGEFYTEPQPI